MRRPPDLGLPRRRSWTWWAVAVSVALHAVLGLTFRVQGRLPPRPEPDSRLIVVVPRTVPQAVDMPYDPGRPGPVAPRESGLRPVTQPTALPVPRPVVVTSETRPLALPDSVPLAPVAGAPAGDGRGGLRPELGEGKLWIRPLPVAPQELAQRLSQSHVALVDSAVTAIVQAHIDSVIAAPAAPGAALPSWTTQIGTAKVGLDSKWIYLGPIKIPSMLLALLNLPQSQVDIRQFRQLQAMREDLAYAARRAETLADFKEAIRQLREERAREREFDRNSRLAPSDSGARRP